MLLTNPKIDGTRTNVPAILNALPRTNPTTYNVSGTIPIPPWSSFNPIQSTEWHYQGIAPYNGTASPSVANGCISASSTAGYFSGFSQAPGANPGVRSVVVPNSNYFHAAGIQMLGDLLAVPLESTNGGNGLVAFYNVGNLAAPVYLSTLTMPAKKASAVGITTYRDASGVEQCLLRVATHLLHRHRGELFAHPVQRLADDSREPRDHHVAAVLEQLEAPARVDVDARRFVVDGGARFSCVGWHGTACNVRM